MIVKVSGKIDGKEVIFERAEGMSRSLMIWVECMWWN